MEDEVGESFFRKAILNREDIEVDKEPIILIDLEAVKRSEIGLSNYIPGAGELMGLRDHKEADDESCCRHQNKNSLKSNSTSSPSENCENQGGIISLADSILYYKPFSEENCCPSVIESVNCESVETSNSDTDSLSNKSFTICEKCLSNRKKEFEDSSAPQTNKDSIVNQLNNSKEICICLADEPTNFQSKDMQSVDDEDPVNLLSESVCHIESLPDELMLKIFSYFSLPDLCRFVAPVCLSWLQYARDSSLWEVISQEQFKDVPTDLLVKVVTSWCSLLRRIDFKCRTDMTITDFVLIFKSCPLVERVSFAFCCQLTDEVIKQVSEYLHNLQYINLEGCQISDAAIIHLFGKRIHGINVSHCNMITDEGLMFLSRNFRNLQQVNLDGIQWISHSSVEVLVDNHSGTLEEIVLDGADFIDDTVRLLSRCQNTRKLSLSFCDTLTDASLQWLLQLGKLQFLALKKGANFTTEGMLHLLKNFSALEGKGLQYLNLAECASLSDECLRALSLSCPNLKILNLSWCWEVTDDGINFIFDSCHEINELHLCGLHELYGIPFRRISAEMPQLKYLDLRQCNKTNDDLLAGIASEIRQLTILNYYGDVVKNNLNYWTLDSKCSPGLPSF